MARLVAAHPDRFAGLAAVDLYRPMAAIAELRRCVNQGGFVGLRIVQWLWGLPPTDRLYYPLFAECCHLDIPVCLQVGHTGPMRPSEPGRPIPYIDQVALDRTAPDRWTPAGSDMVQLDTGLSATEPPGRSGPMSASSNGRRRAGCEPMAYAPANSFAARWAAALP